MVEGSLDRLRPEAAPQDLLVELSHAGPRDGIDELDTFGERVFRNDALVHALHDVSAQGVCVLLFARAGYDDRNGPLAPTRILDANDGDFAD